MSRQQDYYFNEHDENQVKKILKNKKHKKLKRRLKILLVLIVFVLVGAYFMSDYSKIQSIDVIGNVEVETKTVLDHISIDENSYALFVSAHQIEEEVKDIPFIKKANVSKSLLGHVTIEIEEADKIAYCVIGKTTYVIDELGNVSSTKNKELIQSLQSCPRLSGFKDVDFLKDFAKQYVKIPELVKSQTSDIVYAPLKLDESRLKFVMDNGKVLYLRVEDMVNQLSRFDYEAFMTEYHDRCEFSFEGENVYMKKCK